MLDERKVSALNDILLVLFPMVQGNLFGVFEQTRMGKAELALEFGFVRCVRAEWRCDGFDWISAIEFGKWEGMEGTYGCRRMSGPGW